MGNDKQNNQGGGDNKAPAIDNKTEAKPEVKQEVKTEAKPEVKQEVKTEAKPEVKQEVKTEAKPEDKKKKVMFKIETKVEDKKAVLKLTDEEVLSAIGICENNNKESLFVMKKHNGGAMFFVDSINAEQCQDRHKFEYMFTVELKDLNKHLDK